MSPLGTFVEDVCISKEGESVPFSKLYSCYHIWADEHNIRHNQRIKENMFHEKAGRSGYSAGKINGERCIIGLVLTPAYLETVQVQ